MHMHMRTHTHAGKPLLMGQGELDQLDKMVQVLGTPTEVEWPGIKKLPNYQKIVLKQVGTSACLPALIAFLQVCMITKRCSRCHAEQVGVVFCIFICSVLEGLTIGLTHAHKQARTHAHAQMPSQLRQRFTSGASFGGSTATLTEAGFDLLSRLLAWDPEQRLTTEEALQHRWFSEPPLPQKKELMPMFAPRKAG